MEPIKNWFGFTRRERRSTAILLFILFIIIILKHIVPERNIAIEIVRSGFSGTGSEAEITRGDKSTDTLLFAFDPNSASYDTMIMLGFAPKAANTLIRYRNKGGIFRKPSDIRKLHGIDSAFSEKLIPFIVFSTCTSVNEKAGYSHNERKMVDINSCDSLSLLGLPGIGPVLSGRIIKYRHLLGGFARKDQIKEVYGLPEETYDLIKESLFADSLAVAKININSADYKMLRRHPYFENYEVTAILKYRELTGRITGIDDLVVNKLLSAGKAFKVGPYLGFK